MIQRSLIVLAALLSVFACDVEVDEAASPEALEDRSFMPEGDEGIGWSLSLENGNTLRFYAFEDGSVGIAEEGVLPNPSVMNQPELQDASPAEVWLALLESAPVPVPILSHHQRMVQDGAARSFEETMDERAAGWLAREMGDVLTWRATADCVNVTFTSNNCTPGATYDLKFCSLDRIKTNWFWAAKSDRFRAAICVQSGTVTDRLSYYRRTGGSSECKREDTENYIWNTTVGTNGYLTWTWWSPYTSPWHFRDWSHYASKASADAIYDHSIMWRNGYDDCSVPDFNPPSWPNLPD